MGSGQPLGCFTNSSTVLEQCSRLHCRSTATCTMLRGGERCDDSGPHAGRVIIWKPRPLQWRAMSGPIGRSDLRNTASGCCAARQQRPVMRPHGPPAWPRGGHTLMPSGVHTTLLAGSPTLSVGLHMAVGSVALATRAAPADQLGFRPVCTVDSEHLSEILYSASLRRFPGSRVSCTRTCPPQSPTRRCPSRPSG